MKTLLTAAVAVMLSVSSVLADWVPSGPVKVLIGFRAGGGADTLARLISEDIADSYGWTMIPENVTGAGGAVMARELRSAAADGLTIGVGVTDTFAYGVLAVQEPGYGLDDFDVLATIAGTQMGIVARADRGWKTMSDVIAAAKAGEKISFGSMTPRLADGAYYVGKVNGVEFNIVTGFRGGRAVLNAITASDVDIGWVGGPQAAGVRSGDLINLANAEALPLKVSPDAQPLAEIGVDFHFGATFVALAPAGLPEETRAALSDAIAAVIQKDGSKSNTFINRVLVLKVVTGDAADAFVAAEMTEAKALLAATAD
ncbi:tripartite tricarboxylate transporter substrate binding protein [Antarctobacter sp.]|uniref:tripartite tricarboxylate transporter substrate binding protein n=1 Tax=Antarctobacter sp. TaxID=1872577 RepID=UPI002B274AD9|nr:tripartite tricarboxylate transporter substrate binding protein [Antarctobacter sp.]